MRVVSDKISIELENEDEIKMFNSVILFAIKVDDVNHRMTVAERNMAQKLVNITDR